MPPFVHTPAIFLRTCNLHYNADELELLQTGYKTAFISNPAAIGTQQYEWSIPAICGCFGMQDIGLSCFCAHFCFPCNTRTWSNALKYANVDPGNAVLAAYAAGAARNSSGIGQDGWVANFAKLFSSSVAAETGQNTRKDLATNLGIKSDGDASWFARIFCMSCIQWQETDTVLKFYRERMGYKDAHYGSLTRCNCTKFESKSVDDSGSSLTIPFPDGKLVPITQTIYRE